MRLRRSVQVAVAWAALVSPLAAFAQITTTGTVTTAPVGQPAPALAMPMLIALGIALIGFGAYSVRTRSAKAVTGFAVVAGLSLLVGLGYATDGVVIQGADCNTQTMHSYDSTYGTSPLTSLCPNLIQIVAIDACSSIERDVLGDPPPAPPFCRVGKILTNGEVCTLPGCS